MEITHLPFLEVVKDITSKFNKIPNKDFVNQGKYAIIDQGANVIAGYTNDETVITDLGYPVIVFGDHTRVLKYVSYPFAIGADGVKVFSVDTEKAYPLYVFYFLKFLKIPNAGYSRHFKFLKEKKIALPKDIDDQKRIAKVLSQCEVLIQKRKESIDLLDELLKSIFSSMFGSYDEIKQTNLDSLGNNISYLTSGSRGWAKYYTENGAKFLRIQNVGNGIIRTDNLIYVNPPKSAESKRTRVQPGDLVISITADLGRTSVIPQNIGEAYINQHLALIRLNKNINPVYAAYFYNMPFGNNAIQRKNRSAVKAGLNFNDIRSFPIVIPDLPLQNKFAQIVEKVEGIKQAFELSLKELENLYGSISQRAFNGELDLRKIDISDMEDSKEKDFEVVKEDLSEKQFDELIDSFEHNLPTGEVPSNRVKDIRNVSIRQYLGYPEDDDATEGIEFFKMDKDYFYQFILTQGFPDRTFTLPEVERYASNYILRGTGFEFTYENWKNIIFRFIGANQPIIEQVFDEDDKTIKLKLTDEAFKV